MDNVVTISAKKEFIRWFLGKFHLKKKEGTWLFNYLLSDERLLEKIHFTEDVKDKEKTIIISTICSGETPFQFQKAAKIYYDVEQAFHDIRLNPKEDVYITIHFKNRSSFSPYLAVLEGATPVREHDLQEGVFHLAAEIILDRILRKHRLTQLAQHIDDALDAGNKEQFMRLSKEWLELKKLEIEA